MDSAYWASTNPEVTFKETKKLYFGQYLYKILYHVPSAVLITRLSPGQTIVDLIAYRKQQANLRKHYGSSWTKNISPDTDPVILEKFRILRAARSKLKYRFGDNTVGVYSNNESDLKLFNNAVPAVYAGALIEVTGPKDSVQQSLLEAGSILGPNKTGCKFKIMLRDGAYDVNAKKQLLGYLDSLGTDIGMPKSTRRALSGLSVYHYGCYLYANDLSIATFINMIIPGLVGTTYELTKI